MGTNLKNSSGWMSEDFQFPEPQVFNLKLKNRIDYVCGHKKNGENHSFISFSDFQLLKNIESFFY